MGFPFDSPFDANDEISLAQECVKNCRRKSLYVLLCFLSAALCIFLPIKFPNIISKNIAFLGLVLSIGGVYFIVAAAIDGITYLRKYRHTKQGIFSAIGGTVLGGILSLFLLFVFLVPINTGPSSKEWERIAQVSDIRQAGFILLVYANYNNGKYPDDLETFLKNDFPANDEHFKRFFYKKNSQQLRWILTPGLTTNDAPNTILLRSVEKSKDGGLVIFTVGNYAEYIKNSDKYIITVGGKPML